MDVRDIADSLGARWRLITTLTLLGVIAGAAVSILVTPVYTATATALVSVPRETPADVPSAVADALLVRERVASYAHLVTTPDAIEEIRAATEVGASPSELAAAIEVQNPAGSALLEISATDASAQNAQSIANAATGRLQSWVDQLEAPSGGGEAGVTVTITEPAELPASPSSPRTVLNLVLGGVVGLVAGLAAALLLPVRITSLGQLRRYVDRPVLAVVPRENAGVTRSARQVHDALRFVDVDHRPLSLVISEASAGAGASSLAVNLAQTMASSGESVVLVDADSETATLSRALDQSSRRGLTDVLVGDASVDDALQPWRAFEKLEVLPAGSTPPNPADLLGSQAMADLVERLRASRTVIVDSPPVLAGRGTDALARASGGAILVVRSGSTDRDRLRRAVHRIEVGGGRVLGLVLADTDTSGAVAGTVGSDPMPSPAESADVPQTIVPPPTRDASAPPALKTAVPVESKVIGGASGVPLAASPERPMPQVVDLRALERTRTGARLGLDNSRLADVGEVPVGGSVVADEVWQPPPPRAAFDPLTAPYDQLAKYLEELDEGLGGSAHAPDA